MCGTPLSWPSLGPKPKGRTRLNQAGGRVQSGRAHPFRPHLEVRAPPPPACNKIQRCVPSGEVHLSPPPPRTPPTCTHGCQRGGTNGSIRLALVLSGRSLGRPWASEKLIIYPPGAYTCQALGHEPTSPSLLTTTATSSIRQGRALPWAHPSGRGFLKRKQPWLGADWAVLESKSQHPKDSVLPTRKRLRHPHHTRAWR